MFHAKLAKFAKAIELRRPPLDSQAGPTARFLLRELCELCVKHSFHAKLAKFAKAIEPRRQPLDSQAQPVARFPLCELGELCVKHSSHPKLAKFAKEKPRNSIQKRITSRNE